MVFTAPTAKLDSKNPREQSLGTVWGLVRRVLIAAALGLAVLGLEPGCSHPIAQDCTVGYAGSDLNVEIKGMRADSACQQLMKAPPTAGSDQPSVGSGYRRQPGGTLMCRVTLNGLSYSVRDSGALKLYGSAVCGALQAQPSLGA
jgi:hypothetical protein